MKRVIVLALAIVMLAPSLAFGSYRYPNRTLPVFSRRFDYRVPPWKLHGFCFR